MDPERIEQLINAAIDGESSVEENPASSASLIDEPDYKKLSAAIREQDSLLCAAFASRRQAAAALADRVVSSIQTTTPRPASRVLAWLPLLIAAAAGFLLAVILFRPWERAIERPRDVASRGSAAADIVPVAHLTVATGPVDVARPNNSAMFTCPTGGPIQPGADVCTGPQTRCELATTDGSAVRLDRDTKVKFDQPRAISLQQGELWSSISPDKKPFEVKAPQATVTCSDGKFDLQ
ncbi:MAG TPA: FecR domain-containing protein, partial [Pirellulales bacterium]|nr:FecR domain-containing protein [Pirellulales bacterium]